jgi:phosphoesterase RecJ-like protein
MQNNTPQEIWEALKKTKKVAMTLHRGPDGDSLGSATALKYVLERDLKIKVHLVSGDPLPRELTHLNLTKEVDFKSDFSTVDFDKYDIIVCTDSAAPNMLSAKAGNDFTLPKNKTIINIDHHQSNPAYATFNYISPHATSCAEVLLDLFKELKIPMDKELSRRLLIGITSDTGFFRWGVRGPKIFSDVAHLLEAGINFEADIANPLLFNQSLKSKKFLAVLYTSLECDPKMRFCYTAVSSEDLKKHGIDDSEASNASNAIQDIGDCQFIFTLKEKDDGVGVGFRSKKGVDVSKFAVALGGGGHQAASGALLPGMKLEEAKKKVLQIIDEVGIHYRA